MSRIHLLVPALALLLVLPASPVVGQSESESSSRGATIAGWLGTVQDAINELAPGIDPSDPDAPIDPSDPDAPIDPSDPDADPSDIGPDDQPVEPAEPGPEIEDLSEPDGDGGFAEIFLLPDPAPLPGRWKVTNKKGLVTCTNIGERNLKATTETGRITLRDDGRKLTGTKIAADQSSPVNMTWDPEANRYRGKIRLPAPGGTVKMDFTMRVLSPREMSGSLIARVTVREGDIRSKCTISRGLALTRTGN